MSVSRAKLEVDSREFRYWLRVIDWEEAKRKQDPIISYLKQLTAEVRRSWVKHPERVAVSQFDIKFDRTGRSSGGRQNSASIPNSNQCSKQAWLGWAGISAKE